MDDPTVDCDSTSCGQVSLSKMLRFYRISPSWAPGVWTKIGIDVHLNEDFENPDGMIKVYVDDILTLVTKDWHSII